MELIYIGLFIFVITAIIVTFKIIKGKMIYSKAVDAKKQGDDKLAISIFKKALGWAKVKPDLEADILSQLNELYAKHNIKYDFGDYQALTNQIEFLLNKGGNTLPEQAKVNKLKMKMIENMPELP